MSSTYSPTLKIQLMATGENSTTWGTVTNLNLGTAIEEAITGSADVAFSNANVTLTLTDTNASQTARNLRLNLTGTATSGYNLVVPSTEKAYIVNNGTDGTITVKNATGTGIAVPAGKTVWVFNDGTNVKDVVTYLSSLSLGSPLGIASGGTGGNTQASAQSALGLGTMSTQAASGVAITGGSVSGVSLTSSNITSSNITSSNITSTNITSSNATITGGNISGLTTPLSIASGGTGFNTAPTAGTIPVGTNTGAFALSTLTAGSNITITNSNTGGITIAATNPGGTVTSVGGTGAVNGITLTGTVTSSGSLTLGGTLTGVNLQSQVTGILPVANGGTGANTTAAALTSLGAAASSTIIGVGQTWQVPARSVNTSYQNTTGRPIMVAIQADSGNTAYGFQVSNDGSTWITLSDFQYHAQIAFIVPNNGYYRINGTPTLYYWSELR